MMELLKVEDYQFIQNDFSYYFKHLYRDRGFKAVYQFMNRPLRRSYSRKLINTFSPEGTGLEIGVGARTIAPTNRTILSDAFSEHGVDETIAKVFFEGEKIPYENESFDFVLSEHVLEHIANPIKTLKEWIRVLKTDGVIYLFLPHHDRTNDSLRNITTLDHMLEDYKDNIDYNDESHFEDWWNNVVLKGLMPAHYTHLSKKELLDTASIHHHTWTENEIASLLEHLGLEVLVKNNQVHDRRDSFVVVAKKISTDTLN